MQIKSVATCAHNPQIKPSSNRESHSAYCAECLSQIETLNRDLLEAGVILFIEEGRLAFDAPRGAMTVALLDRVRCNRDRLFELLQGLPIALPQLSGVSCPFCRSELLEDVEQGWLCSSCNRLAWVWTFGGSIVRVDFEKIDLAFDQVS